MPGRCPWADDNWPSSPPQITRPLPTRCSTTVAEAGVVADVEKVTDINEIMKFGVMITPALAVDGQVKVVGKVPSPDEIKKMLA